MTPDQFRKPYLQLEAHFEPRGQTEERRQILRTSWYSLVGEYRADVWEEVVARLVRSCKFMPAPVEALSLMEDVALDLHKQAIQEAYDAETERRRAAGIPDRNPKARSIAETARMFRRVMGDRPPAPERPSPADYDGLLEDTGGR